MPFVSRGGTIACPAVIICSKALAGGLLTRAATPCLGPAPPLSPPSQSSPISAWPAPPRYPVQSASAKKAAGGGASQKAASAGKKDKAAAPAVKKTAATKKAAPAKKGPAKKARKVRWQPCLACAWLGYDRGQPGPAAGLGALLCCNCWLLRSRVPACACARPGPHVSYPPSQLARPPVSLVACAAAARCCPRCSRSRRCPYSRPWAYWRHRWRLLSGCGGAEAAPLHRALTGLQRSKGRSAATIPFDEPPPPAPVLPTLPLPPGPSLLPCPPPCLTTLATNCATRATSLSPASPTTQPHRRQTLLASPPATPC